MLIRGDYFNTDNLTDPKIWSILTKNAYTDILILIQGDLNFANTNTCLKNLADTDTGIMTNCNITTGTACSYLYGISVLARQMYLHPFNTN